MGTDFWQVRLFDILRLVTNILIAIVIVYYLKNRYSDRQIQKNLFLEVVSDIVRILDSESDDLFKFMKQTTRNRSNKAKILLLLKRISNKITILEEYDDRFDVKVKNLITRLRRYYDVINEIVVGENDFVQSKSFSDDNINRVLKNIFDIGFVLDQIKLNLFD
ncbi:MAG: hypothetical protein ACYS67_04910 [Planctomycetota bacterium]|jgi:hypothetical protein